MFAAPRPGVQNRYQSSVLIGNWREDQELHSLKVADYLAKKSTGSLLIQHVDNHLKDALQEVGLSYAEDGCVRFGDHVMLYSSNTEGVLSCDPNDRANAGERGFGVSTSTLTKAHVARNTFVIEPYQDTAALPSKQARIGDVLKYGQTFRLRVNPKMCGGEAFYMYSQPLGGISSSKVSRHQEVSFAANPHSFDSVWKVAGRNPNERFALETTPVKSNIECLIVHGSTHQALSSSPLRILNDFGSEFEVCAATHTATAKNAGLFAEFQGKRTGLEASRREHAENHWILLTATSPDRARLLRRDTAQTLALIHHLLQRVQSRILEQGQQSLQNLSFELWRRARDSIDCLPYAAFVEAVTSMNLGLNADESELLCNQYDKANDGFVDYTAFLEAVRGPFKRERREAVSAVWQMLDQKGDDQLPLDQFLVHLVPSAPDSQYIREYFSRVSQHRADKGSVINFERFSAFYANVAAFTDSDDFFEHTLRSTWQM